MGLVCTHPRVRGRKRWLKPKGSFYPTQLAQLSGWLRLAASSQSGGEWTPSIVDIVNAGAPMVQTGVNRRAAVGATFNGFPTMVFDGTDVHLWPVSPAFASTTKMGLFLWYKPEFLGGTHALYGAVNGVAGSTTTRIALYQFNDKIIVEAYLTNAIGRSFVTAASTLTVSAWHAIYMQYDSSRGGDANVALFVNGVSKALTPTAIGGGGPTDLAALQAATGSGVVGGFSDSDTPLSGLLNGEQIGPNIFAFNDNLTTAQEINVRAFEAPFSPTQVSAVSGWLRLVASQQSGGEWTPSIVDVINAGSPMVQTDIDRRAAVGVTTNGLPTMVFDGTDVHLWQQSPALSSTTKVGLWLWYKPATVAGVQRLYTVASGVAGSANNRLQFYAFNTQLVAEVYASGNSGRNALTASGVLSAGVWHAIYYQYDSSRGGDANLAIFVNGVSLSLTNGDMGSGGAMGVLQTAGGSAVVGAGVDSDTPTSPIANGGEIGPNLFALNDNLTVAQIAAFLAFEVPT